MKISIGILAYNESATIAKTLESLSRQSLFDSDNQHFQIEIIVVPNGCTDSTSLVAHNALKSLFPIYHENVSWKVFEQDESGKSNAWNTYVHKLSDLDAKYLFLMDSDIKILDRNTLKSMISILEKDAEAWISVDKPIKNVVFKEKKTFSDRLSIFASGLSGANPKTEGPAWICGQLYCARANKLREIHLPKNLAAEDSFLYTTIVTDGLRFDINPNRVVLADSATHEFEAYTRLNQLLRHEKWLIISSAINEIIFEFLRSKKQDSMHIGSQIKKLNEMDDNWLLQCTQQAICNKGFWLIPRFILLRRFISLLHKPLLKAILLFPISCLAFGVDLFLSIQANTELRRNFQVGYWGKQ